MSSAETGSLWFLLDGCDETEVAARIRELRAILTEKGGSLVRTRPLSFG